MYKKLICFDFDGTLFNTLTPIEGMRVWKENTGTDWPYGGWWGKADSIDPEIFYIPLNQWVYRKYLEAVSDPENFVILATGRLRKAPRMLDHIETLLNKNNIVFDEVHLCWGGDTFSFKTRLFEEMIEKMKVDELVMYDDRHEHLVRFEEWAKDQNVNIKIVDVIHKKETIFSNNI